MEEEWLKGRPPISRMISFDTKILNIMGIGLTEEAAKNSIIEKEDKGKSMTSFDTRTGVEALLQKVKRSNSEPFFHSWDFTPIFLDKRPDEMNLTSKPITRKNRATQVALVDYGKHPSIEDVESWSEFLRVPSVNAESKDVITDESGSIQAASEDFLVSLLSRTPAQNNNPMEFVQQYRTILYTHTSFIDSYSFLKKLIKPFEDPNLNEEIGKRIIHALTIWMNFKEINDIPECIEEISKFCNRMKSSHNFSKHIKQIEDLIQIKPPAISPKPEKKEPLRSSHPRSKSLIKLFNRKVDGTLGFLDIHPLEFAKHLTARDFRIFQKIKAKELLSKGWIENGKGAPNIVKLIRCFNETSMWMAGEILLTPNPKQRVIVIQRFIEMGEHFETLKNFRGIQMIVGMFDTSPIRRLHHDWKQVSKKHKQTLTRLQNLFDNRMNYKFYRDTIRLCSPPYIPFEGILLKDIIHIDENEDQISGLINVQKLKMLGDIIHNVKRLQKSPFNFGENAFIAEYLEKTPTLDEDTLFALSKRCEPIKVV